MDARKALGDEHDQTVARIDTMTGELDALAAASAGSNLDDEHDPDGNTIAFEREQFAALLARARHHLAEIDAAIVRLGVGGYGRCESCGREIAPARLAALPAARRCVECANHNRT